MLELRVIQKKSEPTPWVNYITIVKKQKIYEYVWTRLS